MLFTEVVRERGKVYAVNTLEGVPKAVEVGEDISSERVLEGKLRFVENNGTLTISSDALHLKVQREFDFERVSFDGRSLVGKLLITPRWLGEVVPLYDMEKGKIILLRGEEEEPEVLLEDVGRVLFSHSTRCGGVTRTRFIAIQRKRSALYEIDVKGKLSIIDEFDMNPRGITDTGTTYNCKEHKCFFVDCEGNSIIVKESITVFSNAAILDERYVAFNVVRKDSDSFLRLIIMDKDSNISFNMPYVELRNPWIIDAWKGVYLLHGEHGELGPGVFLYDVDMAEGLLGIISSSITLEEAIIDPAGHLVYLKNGKIRTAKIEYPWE